MYEGSERMELAPEIEQSHWRQDAIQASFLARISLYSPRHPQPFQSNRAQ
jgi:hypothetical protein